MTDAKTALRRRTVLAAALAAAGLAFTGEAQATPDAGLVDLQVINRETGQPARVWRRDGRLFVAGQPGARYSLRVTNLSHRRVLVVMSVDGINVLTGETAGFDQRGYVFEAYQAYDISGWRKTDSEVAAFTFAPLSRSYAARTGRPNDVGVIGIAAFTERYVPPPPPPPPRPAVSPEARDESDASTEVESVVVTGALQRGSPSAAPRAAPAPAEKLGTGHGAREWSSVTRVNFQRETSYPQQISRIEYDSTQNLIAAGVIPRPQPTPPRPRPFPANPGYVPDPPYGR